MNGAYETSLRYLIDALDAEIARVEELRTECARYPTGTVAILTTIAPALQVAKAARAAVDVNAMRDAHDRLAAIE